jgi:hypothetical protein
MPHQPALAHCVRIAGLHALRLTALLCVRAGGQPLAVPLRVASPSETPYRERPGTNVGPVARLIDLARTPGPRVPSLEREGQGG